MAVATQLKKIKDKKDHIQVLVAMAISMFRLFRLHNEPSNTLLSRITGVSRLDFTVLTRM